jgi:hypothetical protein
MLPQPMPPLLPMLLPPLLLPAATAAADKRQRCRISFCSRCFAV